MKNISLILAILILTACESDGNSSQDINQQALREVDAGQPVSSEFQSEYSTYIWNDEPKVYVPRFGTIFDLTSATKYSVQSTELDGLDDITVEFWFSPDLVGPFDNDGSTVFWTSDTQYCSTSDQGFYFQWQDQAQEFRVGSCYPGSGGHEVFLESDLVEESNYVVIETHTDSFKVFLNGVLVKDLSLDYEPVTGAPFYIGYNVADGQNYIGNLDNFAVYDRTLTTDEIIQHYAVGSDLLKR